MKGQGFEKSSAGALFPRARETQADSDKPTVVHAPIDALLANERAPRTLPKSSLHDALLEFEQERESRGVAPAGQAGSSRPPNGQRRETSERRADTDAALGAGVVLGAGEPPGRDERRPHEGRRTNGERPSDPHDERRPDGRLRRESDPDARQTQGEHRRGSAELGVRWHERAGQATGLDDLDGFEDEDELGARLERNEISHVGQVIDNRYLVESLIARGGMGVVYRCRHQVIGKRFAVKIIRSNMAHLSDAPRRFLMEAKAASAIGNEHIIDIVDYGSLADGSAYLVMELLEGMPLSDLIARHDTLPTRRIVSIAMQVCEGLRAAHAAGIVHRDLKPENIFLSNRRAGDFVKILDFGIAKMSMPGEPLTKKGLIVGTPHYMSPEQAAGLPVDPRGDIYSLGVILYELATGRVPFDATHYMAVLAKHMTAPPPPFDSLGLDREQPSEFEAVVQTCLAKRPEERFQSMAELLEALERLFRRLPPTAPLVRGRLPSVDLLSSPPPPPRETTRAAGPSLPAAAGRTLPAPPRRRDLGLALLAVVVLGVSLLSVWRMRAPESRAARGRVGSPETGFASAPEPQQSGSERLTRALEPAPVWPPPRQAPGASGLPPPPASDPGEPPGAASPSPEPSSKETVTVVELAPGKSVEIEARTRLSLRLAEESRALAEARGTDELPPLEPKPRAVKRRRPRLEAAPAPAGEPGQGNGQGNGLINPWPAPR
jgi:eukaryotic-like serine/threonine-protein kinase